MFTNSVLAVTGALLSVVAAVPMADQHHHQHHHNKRDYVWVTHTEEEVVTVPVTKTVWIEPGETPPTGKPQGYSPPAAHTPDVEPAATSAPAPKPYTPEAPAYTPEAPAYTPEAPSSPDTPSYEAPTTSTSVYVAPTPTTPTSTYVPPPAPTTYAAPTTSEAPAPAPAPAQTYGSSSGSDSGSSSGGVSGLSSGMAKAGTSYTGDLTYYTVGLGACGWTNTQDEKVVAVAESIFDSYDNGNPNNNPLCGKYVTITGKDGNPWQAKIVDRCPGCAEADLDCSIDFFNNVTMHGDGRVGGMKWSFD